MSEILYGIFIITELIFASMVAIKGNIPYTIIDCTMIIVMCLCMLEERRERVNDRTGSNRLF